MNEPLKGIEQKTIDHKRRPAVAMRRGANDQAAAYEALIAAWADTDLDEDERDWQLLKQHLQDTRRTLGQRPLFTE